VFLGLFISHTVTPLAAMQMQCRNAHIQIFWVVSLTSPIMTHDGSPSAGALRLLYDATTPCPEIERYRELHLSHPYRHHPLALWRRLG